MHIQFTWDTEDDEGHLSHHADVVPRVGETVSITYKEDDDLPELTTVSGFVDSVHWNFDNTSGSPYPRLFIVNVKKEKWMP